MVATAPTTIASPRPARRTSRRFPSRNATASCIGKRDSGYGISSGSTNEIPAAKRKNAAGPANGNHRRANTGSTRIASAGRQNHSVVVGAPDEPRPSTTSSIATIASSAISRSNQYVRARCSIRLTHRTYSTSSRTASHKVRPGIPLKYYPPPNRQPGDDAAPATPRPNGAHTLADDAHTAHHWRAHGAAATRARTRRRNRYRSVPALAAKTAASPPQRSSSRTTASDPPTAKGGLEPGCPCRRQTRAQNPSAGWYRSSPISRRAASSAIRLRLPIGSEFRFGMNSGTAPAPMVRSEGACRSPHSCRRASAPALSLARPSRRPPHHRRHCSDGRCDAGRTKRVNYRIGGSTDVS